MSTISSTNQIKTMLTTKHYWQSPYIDWVDDVPEGWILLIFYIRSGRNKAIVPAVVEALSLLRPFNPIASSSGPLADQKGVFWIGIECSLVQKCSHLFKQLGYTFAIDQAICLSVDQETDVNGLAVEEEKIVRWRGKRFRLHRLYREDPRFMRNRAPDRRAFLLEDRYGNVVTVKGYRGDGYDQSRRGLPVEDARMLVNLVTPDTGIDGKHRFLDPFAGVGGIVIEAIDGHFTTFSLDNEPRLRYGLRSFGAFHVVGNAMELPFASGTFSAIGTEPPYHRGIKSVLPTAFTEMHRILKEGGRLSILVSPWQAESLLNEADQVGMELFLASPVNRKGTPVVVLGWTKTA